MTSAPEAFEKWWQSLRLGGFMSDEIMPDHVRQAFDLGVMFERERCAKIVEDEGPCRHVDHVQGFCACQEKADAIRKAE